MKFCRKSSKKTFNTTIFASMFVCKWGKYGEKCAG